MKTFQQGLAFPTSVAWDDEGKMYVAEAGGGLGSKSGRDGR